ncbi:MAG: 1-deoxy-D-xylulose-5-phosphate reductoisomerase [Aquificae bacterium]|nr:1-deoxy-D-xylulose-5-phosphate reductoisomerase [Aquificota bacterium]
MDLMETVAVLGSTGSIGTQTLDIIRHYPDKFRVELLYAKRASDLLLEQVKEFKPSVVITEDKPSTQWLKELPSTTQHFLGLEGFEYSLQKLELNKVVNAIGGIFGIAPSFVVLKKTHSLLLLANKETIIAAGDFLNPFWERIIPLDSEHNALFQLLKNLKTDQEVEKIVLTASGGPFRSLPKEELKKVSPQRALKHPRWKMGKKITVDSATLMNKGFEVIEAHYLFKIPYERIEVLIHPESIIHGMVQTIDGNLFALMSPTDMRFPIHYALFYPLREKTYLKPLDLTEVGKLTFEKPDWEKFECLKIAYEVGKKGFPYTAYLVGADEAAVELFLEGKINFLDIPKLIMEILNSLSQELKADLEAIESLVKQAYLKAQEIGSSYRKRY